MIYLSTLLLALFVTVSLIPLFVKIAGKISVLDIPDERKVHATPIPRIGGLAMAIGVFVTMMLWGNVSQFLRAFVIGAIIIVFFGAIDDSRGLTYKIKFAGQIAAALVIVCYGGLRIVNLGSLLPDNATVPSWIGVPLTVVLIVGVTNAVNLSDGLDGLAGGLSLLGFCCIGYLAYLENNVIIALISVSLIGAISGSSGLIPIRRLSLWAIREASFSVSPSLPPPYR
jgi:UDP-GlcNAc:undecaprenyl-phosphate GlcNAc-1-phosphate transferase